MPKLDPYSLPRPKRTIETKTFALDGDDYPLTLTLADRLTVAGEAAALDEQRRLTETYLTGSEIRGAAPFPDPEVEPSETLFRLASRIARLQAPENPADAYDTMELLLLSVRVPKSFGAAVEWMNARVERNGQEPGE